MILIQRTGEINKNAFITPAQMLKDIAKAAKKAAKGNKRLERDIFMLTCAWLGFKPNDPANR